MDKPFKILTDYSLYLHNSLRVSVSTRHFVRISQISELQALVCDPIWHHEPRFILGGGSNTLFLQDFQGLVVHVANKGIEAVAEDEHSIVVRCAAGERWDDVVAVLVGQGLYGVENLSMIPGTVGAAPIQNIGAYGVELCDVFESLTAMLMSTGELVNFNRERCQFGYRDSVFKRDDADNYVILSVDLRLSKQKQLNLSYYALKQAFDERDVDEISINEVREAVMAIRRSKLPDPEQIPNAGSFFKNPVISIDQFDQLAQDYQNLPQFPADAGRVKIPAAWLIEHCGWKGKRQGNVGVHDRQALVLVNHGGGDGLAIKNLAQAIQADVKQQFGIELEPEVRFL